jgi:hypothetical protein
MHDKKRKDPSHRIDENLPIKRDKEGKEEKEKHVPSRETPHK